MNYKPLPIAMDLNPTSLMQAAAMLPAGRVYRLFVPEHALIWVRRMLVEIGASTKDNPFAPYVNLEAKEGLGSYEWVLALGDQAVGSEGGV